MGFNCFCCRTYCCMINAKRIEEANRKSRVGPGWPWPLARPFFGHGPWPGFHCRVWRMHRCIHITLVSLFGIMVVFCDGCKTYLSHLIPSACIACLSLCQM